MGSSLAETISSIRIEISDRDKSLWQDDEIIRAIDKTCSLMSRLLPKKSVVKVTLLDAWIDGNYLDISSILSASDKLGDNIQRVEYPAGSTPPELIPVEVMGSYLWLKTNVPVTAGKDIRITYQGVWTPPTHMTPGDYPPHLNDVVIIGAAGQALIYKSEYYTQKAASAVDATKKVLDDLLLVTFPDAPDITTGELNGLLTSAKTTLGKAQTAFGTSLTTLDSMTSPLTEGSARISCLPAAATNARAYLDDGEPFINAGTRGDKVGETYNQYAITEVALGREHVQSGVAYVQVAGGWEAKAGRQSIIANGYVQEAAQYLAAFAKILDTFGAEVALARSQVDMYRAQLESATRDTNLSSQYLNVGSRFLASGQSKINEFLAACGVKVELHRSSSSSEQRS